MAAIGPTMFSILLWGSVFGVFLVFVFEVYTLAGGTSRLVRN
ncbi:hypothetical protein [Halogeometricum borinquense]|nr:hypothetical protein [Halogeometricum borinquense]